jgi:hypothetical protein
MTIGPLEAQLLVSSLFAIPAIAILLFAVFRGHFSRQEGAKYVVFTARDEQEDFWDDDWNLRLGRSAVPKDRPQPTKGER